MPAGSDLISGSLAASDGRARLSSPVHASLVTTGSASRRKPAWLSLAFWSIELIELDTTATQAYWFLTSIYWAWLVSVSATKEHGYGYGDGVIPASCMTAWRLAKPVVPGSCKSRRAGASTRSSSDESGTRSPKSKTQSAGG
jgi:hypothetical protein